MVEALSEETIFKTMEIFQDQDVSDLKDQNVNKPQNKLDVPEYLAKYGFDIVKIKPHKGSILYILNECVFDPNHKGKEAAIGQTAEGKLFYQCFHSSCEDRKWHEARQIISGNDPLFGRQSPSRQSGKPIKQIFDQEWSGITLENIFTKEIKDEPIIKNLIHRDENTILYSAGGVGKSLIAQDIAMHMAAGMGSLWAGFDIPKPRATLFVQSENSRLAVHQRTRLKCKGNTDFVRGLQNIFYSGIGENIEIAGHVSNSEFCIKLIDFTKKIEKENEIKFDLIIFDPLISYHDAEENDNSRMRTTLDYIKDISNEIKATPIVSHHAGKDGTLRGASAIVDWARNLINLKDASYLRRKQIKFINEKVNNHPKFEAFTLAMDEFLNFERVDVTEAVPKKARERGQKVKEALELLGGRAESKSSLIDQYKEITAIKSESTAKRHIDKAAENNFIKQEFYYHGKLKKGRYYLD